MCQPIQLNLTDKLPFIRFLIYACIRMEETMASRGTKGEGIVMHQDLHGSVLSALHEFALPGPSRPTGDAIAAVRAASTSTATSPAASEVHYQTFALK